MNANELLSTYEKSHFVAFVALENVASPADQARAAAAYERDPVAALVANVNQAREDVRATEYRIQAAKQDGLFDADAYRCADKLQRKRWADAIDTLRGDYARARAELEHWRGYVRWATEEQEAKVARLEAMQPDRRLPVEAETEEGRA